MKLPAFGMIKQLYPHNPLPDAAAWVNQEFARTDFLKTVKPGQSVAITAGSRGIKSMPQVLAGIVHEVKKAGGKPFIIPAMGSHGGGTGPGQAELLDHLGINEKTVGAPIHDRYDPIKVGEAKGMVPVYADKASKEADHVILVNRVKEHTEYQGETESGLIKMAAIGLGRQMGAETTHRLAVNITYYEALHAVAKVLFENLNVLGGVAILEDQLNTMRRLEAVPVDLIFEREPEILKETISYKPKLPYEELDLLIIDEIGKEISGTGADTKVVGRIMNIYEKEAKSPNITRIVIRDLSEKTDGNAIGLGLADYTTQKAVDKINLDTTLLNCVTGGTPEKGRIPLYLANDQKAIETALRTVGVWDETTLKAAWIINSKDLEVIAVSQKLWQEAKDSENTEPLGKLLDLPFDEDGNLPKLRELIQK
ncbi:DUF362 domain-containing protein [Dethiosulfatarculus sandiegensis]|uniref:DUF362 domain-containing protein n=1 Tax=Dethiosulfatarculus sandiegensis TaxID=1429043 RepID=A0A0D2JHE2_9BACT|nr:DUF362 domain-containing protein [Dethiosulfatarculus sandiegensis]KIX15161.1 hypothetical protein X474_05325 [Dethiosulfatarculus sandiegensis]